jgi:hypothetical protein
MNRKKCKDTSSEKKNNAAVLDNVESAIFASCISQLLCLFSNDSFFSSIMIMDQVFRRDARPNKVIPRLIFHRF